MPKRQGTHQAATRRSSSHLLLALLVATMVSATGVALSFTPTREASAATAALSFEPSAGVLATGDQLDVKILQDADVGTTGVKVDVIFACGPVEVVDVKVGAAYTLGTVLVGVSPQTKEEAIADANRLGVIKNLAAFKAPGKAVDVGIANVLTITFRGRGGFTGTSPLKIVGAEVLDTVGDIVPITTSDGSLQVTGAGPTLTATPTFTPTTTATATDTPTITPSPTGTPVDETQTPTQTPPTVCEVAPQPPTSTPTVTQTPAPTNTALPEGCSPTLTPTFTSTATPLTITNTPQSPTSTFTNTPTPSLSATLMVRPASVAVPPGSDVVIELVQNAPSDTLGIQTDVTFDRTLLEVLAVEVGTAYGAVGGQLIYPNPTEELAFASNCRGLIDNLGVTITPPGKIVPGETVVFILKMRARSGVTGTSAITLTDSHITVSGDDAGSAMQVVATNGEVTIDPNAPTPTPTATATLEPAAATAAAQQTAAAISTVAGTTSGPGSGTTNPATGLPSAGAWFGEDGSRSLILGISAITLLTSLIALANTWVRRRKA